jgi:hypothetical protein
MSRITAAVPATTTPETKRPKRPTPRKIDWGLLAEPEMQSLIRGGICNNEKSKISKMYNWLGHVLDGQSQDVLLHNLSKGVELERIPMVVCGMFLDRVVPYLNTKCHKECVVEAHYVEVTQNGVSPDWKLDSRMWMPETVEETPRQRAGTLDVLMNGGGNNEDQKEPKEVKWQRRFSLKGDQPLGRVHIRIGLEKKSF